MLLAIDKASAKTCLSTTSAIEPRDAANLSRNRNQEFTLLQLLKCLLDRSAPLDTLSVHNELKLGCSKR